MERADAYVERARRTTGLGELGTETWREGLERLIAAVRSEARLNQAGIAQCEGMVTMLLMKRLEIEDWYARHPEIDDQQITRPLLILGLPRTGSTALHCLLGEDPQARVIRNWEGMNPCPPPERATYETDPRIAVMQGFMDRRDRVTPRMKQMLPSTATSPVEDQLIMGYDFKTQIFQAEWRIPSYVEWFNHQADLVPTFEYVKRVLKLLQWRCPPDRWRLKNPTYILFPEALDRVFPDAKYCMTHRDVAAVLPSVSDLYFERHGAGTDAPDKRYLGELNIEWTELGMQRMIAFRAAGTDVRFFDIMFAPFQKDPFPVLEQLYAFIGEEFTPEARAAMEAWRRDTPRDKHGGHDYDAADFGLDPAVLRERFRFYSERYDVPTAAY
ncbi:MAG: sulfotransferase [Novosphingobium sp.]